MWWLDTRAAIAALLLLSLPVLLLPHETATAQTITWSDPQSPILTAVVTNQRLASEREVGNILVLRGGRPFAAVTRMTLVNGDSLVTGDQTAIIGYADRSWEAVVHPNTQIDFRGGEIRVIFGRMFVQLKSSEQNLLPISVTSKYGTVTSGNASFEVDVSDQRAVIAVISGAIVLTRPSSERIGLQALDEAVLIAEAPVVTRPIGSDRLARIGKRIASLARLGVVISPGTSAQAAVHETPGPAEPALSAEQRTLNRDAQRLLNSLDYDAGPADGVAGPRTQRAVAAYRLDKKLPGTTEIDEALIAALETSAAERAASVAREAPAAPPKTVAATPSSPPDEAAPSPDGADIPDVVGLDFDKARLMLIQKNQLIGRVIYEPDDSVEPGTVLRQTPPPGVAERRQINVDLVIAREVPAPEEETRESATAVGLPPSATRSAETGGTTGIAVQPPADVESYLAAKGFLGDGREVAGLFRPEQKLDGSDIASKDILSRDELSSCLRIEDNYLAQKLRVEEVSRMQDDTADKIAALDVRLDEVLPQTDPNKPESLKAYNAILDRRHRLFADYKDQILPQTRAEERELDAIAQEFQADCGERFYRSEDLEAARKEASLPD